MADADLGQLGQLLLEESQVVEVEVVAGEKIATTALFSGRVDDVSLEYGKRLVRLRGRDRTAELIEAKTTEKWPNRTSSEIATMLAQRDRLDEALSLARAFTLRNPMSASAWATRQRLCRAGGDGPCTARSTAILARLHGQSVSVPPPPPEETTGSPDYSAPLSDDGDSTP